ncbi:efflux RND transporter periplasmic adaptor subunit [Alkanindiges sp. WGS2144]|uniref:efflux RND transporter periplasmic adaptor subunit n=1 Tax=Alkanindiges sp. WGS2144 TaxID=3366808 RepID=UPI003751E289
MNNTQVIQKSFYIVCLSWLLLAGCQKQETAVPAAQKTQALELIYSDLVKPEYRTLSSQINFTGTLEARQRTSVQAQTTGTVQQIHVNNGDHVDKNQTLLRINNQDDQARLLQARANYTAAKAQADLSQNLAERNRRLFKQGFIAEIEYERSKAEARAQRENQTAQQALIDIAQKAVNDATVYAPISGVVSDRQVDVGQTVNNGQTLFEIVNPNMIELQGSVPDSYQVSLKVGQSVQFHFAGQEKPVFSTRISRINPVANPASRALLFYADVNNSATSLNIGNYVEGTILLDQGQSGLVIPQNAIWQASTQSPYVWVIRQNKIHKISINILAQDAATNSAMVTGIQPVDLVSRVEIPENSNGRPVKITGTAL